jgi:hypothetical protein
MFVIIGILPYSVRGTPTEVRRDRPATCKGTPMPAPQNGVRSRKLSPVSRPKFMFKLGNENLTVASPHRKALIGPDLAAMDSSCLRMVYCCMLYGRLVDGHSSLLRSPSLLSHAERSWSPHFDSVPLTESSALLENKHYGYTPDRLFTLSTELLSS